MDDHTQLQQLRKIIFSSIFFFFGRNNKKFESLTSLAGFIILTESHSKHDILSFASQVTMDIVNSANF